MWAEGGGGSKAGVKGKDLISFIHSYTGFRVFANAFFEEVRFPLEAYHFHPFELLMMTALLMISMIRVSGRRLSSFE